MNVTLKIEDELCRKARHRAVDADLSLSGWVAQIIEKELNTPPASNEARSILDRLAAEDGRGFEEFLPDRKADTPREIDFH
jgi:hypothetical protein